MIPSKQQQDIIDNAKDGKSIAIEAIAGSGKTQVLNFIASNVPKNALYLAFNKSIADEAISRFPGYVTCKTIHSIAWKEIIKYSKSPYGRRLQGNWDFNDINVLNLVFNTEDDLFECKLQIFEALNQYCTSTIKNIYDFVALPYEIDTEGNEIYYSEDIQNEIVRLWRDILDEKGTCKITHNVYLKLFTLTDPVLPYEIIYFDESQDSNAVTAELVFNQYTLYNKQVIIVGDPHQAIYGFNNCINAFNILPEGFIHLPLSESYRYTQEIADIAKSILSINREPPVIIGKEISNGVRYNENQQVYLVRKNTTALETILNSVSQGLRIKCYIDLKDLWNKMFHIEAVLFNKPIKYPSRDLINYTKRAELLTTAKKLDDIKTLLNCYTIVSNGGLWNNKKLIEQYLTDVSEDADVIILTAHKAKGLTFDEVTITDDFVIVDDDEQIEDTKCRYKNDETLFQEVNLLYVAATRAKYKVYFPQIIKDIFELSS